MGALSIWHWLIVLLIVVMVFGTKKLKNMGSDLGGAVKGFKKAMHEEEKDGDKPSDQPQAKVAHEENGNTYDVQADQKPAADVHSGDRNEERK